MQIGRRDEDMHARTDGRRERPGGAIDVIGGAAGERGNRRARQGRRNEPDRLGIRVRCDGKPRFDDVRAQSLELTGHEELLFDAQREARRLLAVSERRVEHADLLGSRSGVSHCAP
jgi:hypothetical protein